MSQPVLLKGNEIERFCMLLKKSIPYHVAVKEARNPESDLIFPEEEMLNVLRAYTDPWVYNTVKENSSSFSTEFRKAFRDRYDKGETVKEAADQALRKTDSIAAARYGQTELRRPEAINLGKIRLAVGFANGCPITKELFIIILERIRKHIEQYYSEGGFVPHFVDCAFVKRSGYIRIICADKVTARWLVNFLHCTQLSPPATFCIMRERKFERSCIISSCLEDSSSDEVNTFLENLHKQNADVNITKWRILTTKLREDGKSRDISILLPNSDLKTLEPKKLELHYKLTKVKFSVPSKQNRKKGSEDVLLQGIFPECVVPGNILELIESENDDIDTFRWKVFIKSELKGEDKKKYVWLQFYVDEESANIIEENHNQINFMSQKIKLYQKIKGHYFGHFNTKLKSI